MGWVRRLGGAILVVVFLAALLGRSITANPAIRPFLQGESSSWSLLLALPLVALSIVILALRVRNGFGEDHQERYESEYTPVESNSWDGASEPGPTDEFPAGTGTAAAVATSNGEEQAAGAGTARSQIQSGSGDMDDSDVDIEEEPPEASLRDHLDHLRTQLGEDDEVRPDLHQLESVVDEVEGEPTVPRRCPGEHCDAIWSERTIFGDHRGKYAVLEDGDRVQCLECERVISLD